MSRPWMPLYVRDYLSDTARLSTLEHGAYLLLIMSYWKDGGIPSDDDDLSYIVGLSMDEWLKIKPRIQRLFKDGWRHKRIDEELAKAEEKYERRANAGRKGGLARAATEQSPSNAKQCFGIANQPQPQPEPEPENKNTEIVANPIDGWMASPTAPRKASRAKPRTQIPEDLQPSEKDRQASIERGLDAELFRTEWRKFRDYHRAKGSLMADWSAAWRTWLSNVAQFQHARAGPSGQPERRNSYIQATTELITEGVSLEPEPNFARDETSGAEPVTISLLACRTG